jgi:hypothetical protein
MKMIAACAVAVVLSSVVAGGQVEKPAPKDSVRVSVAGCAKGYMFTAGPKSEDRPGGSVVPEGTHLRMNGPKAMIAEIKREEGSRVEITGLIRKGQFSQEGVAIGGGVRIKPGAQPGSGGLAASVGATPIMIDIEGWRRVGGDCPR